MQETQLQNWRTHDGLFAVDSQQRIVYWADTAERLLGYRAEQVMGKRCYEVVGGRDASNYPVCRRNCPVIMSARRGRTTPDYDILCPLPSGEEKWLNVSVLVARPSRGSVHVLHFLRDVSHRRRTEEFARRASAAVRGLLQESNGQEGQEVETAAPPLPKLSRREQEALRLLAAGMSTRQMAETMGIQPVTARNHVTRLLNKLGAKNRLQAVVYASQRRLL